MNKQYIFVYWQRWQIQDPAETVLLINNCCSHWFDFDWFSSFSQNNFIHILGFRMVGFLLLLLKEYYIFYRLRDMFFSKRVHWGQQLQQQSQKKVIWSWPNLLQHHLQTAAAVLSQSVFAPSPPWEHEEKCSPKTEILQKDQQLNKDKKLCGQVLNNIKNRIK